MGDGGSKTENGHPWQHWRRRMLSYFFNCFYMLSISFPFPFISHEGLNSGLAVGNPWRLQKQVIENRFLTGQPLRGLTWSCYQTSLTSPVRFDNCKWLIDSQNLWRHGDAWSMIHHISSWFRMICQNMSEQSRYASLLNSKKLMCRVVGWLLQNVTCLLVKLSTHIFETHQVLVMLQYMLKSCWYILPSSPRGVSGHGDLLRSMACIAFNHTGCQANALLGSWPKKASHDFSRVVYIQTTMWLCHMCFISFNSTEKTKSMQQDSMMFPSDRVGQKRRPSVPAMLSCKTL